MEITLASRRKFFPRAFTLIELLIVVAIVAILALIAVPNFLEAQVRAKVARAQADMRTLATALETYAVDSNRYPPPFAGLSGESWSGPSAVFSGLADCVSARLIRLTTPIAYISSVGQDPFYPGSGQVDGQAKYDTYDYFTDNVDALGRGRSCGAKWRLVSAGPDHFNYYGGYTKSAGLAFDANVMGCRYDPTNGTVSIGDVIRVGPPSQEGEEPFYDRIRFPAI